MSLTIGTGLRAKLSACLLHIGGVAKAGQNKDQGYAFQKAADIFEKVQSAFGTFGVAFYANEKKIEWPEPLETKNGGRMFRCYATMTFKFMDTEKTGPDGVYETIEVEGTGVGFDTSDKALNKAKTQALKYVLKNNFLIGEEGDDGDEESPGDEGDRQPCPLCGNVGSLGPSQFGPELYCYPKRGGCGAKVAKEGPGKEAKKPEPKLPPLGSVGDLLEGSAKAAAKEHPPAPEPEPAKPKAPVEGGDLISEVDRIWVETVASETNTLLGGLLSKVQAHSTAEIKQKAFKEYVEPFLKSRLEKMNKPKPNM